MYSTGIYNYGRWNNPEFDKLVDQARTSRDDAERRSLYAQAEQIEVVDDAADYAARLGKHRLTDQVLRHAHLLIQQR